MSQTLLQKKYNKKSEKISDFDIDQYLRQSQENFSDYDDYSVFDGDDYSVGGLDDVSYKVNVVNSTGGYSKNLVNSSKKAILFGFNEYSNSPNYGSENGIEIKTNNSNISYLYCLNQSAKQPFETTIIRLNCSNKKQFEQKIILTSKDANGKSYSIVINPIDYNDSYIFNNDVIDIQYAIRIDGNTHLELNVLEGTSLTITLFNKNSFGSQNTNPTTYQFTVTNKVEKNIAEQKTNKILLLLSKK